MEVLPTSLLMTTPQPLHARTGHKNGLALLVTLDIDRSGEAAGSCLLLAAVLSFTV